jgi:pimeloyl-ACP methyl ester carboxylesterase
VRKLIAIEGLGASPRLVRERAKLSLDARMRAWIDEQRDLSARLPRRYASLEDALKRMQEENKHLSPAQARHLTLHGVNQNEDGTFSWKFDNYVRSWPAFDMATPEVEQLWASITCPTLLVYGKESGASDPSVDGRARHFQHATVVTIDGAGHWVHHDQFENFLGLARDFIAVNP